MIRACVEQAAALQTLPLEGVIERMQLNEDQRAALEQVRTSAGTAAEALDADCPRSIPVELGAKLDTLRDALSLLADSFSQLRPAFVTFHDLLDDEQKGRLLAIGLSGNRASGSDQTGTRTGPAAGGAEPPARPICTRWGMILASWPVEQIDAGIGLSYGQRAALYGLSAVIYRSVADLVDTCPDDNASTALGRLDARHAELQAVRGDIEAIRPSAIAFDNALNDTQKRRLAAAIGSGTGGQQVLETVGQSSVDSEHRGGTRIGARGRHPAHVRSPWYGFAFVPHWYRY
jgi:hypothetical protein